ncbi:MAG TPA: MarR family transcriptional regulator [Polyangiaceae bacterium]|jgi:DNA-binding MarR family transcriptional regulator|nr:MarR family transcriptional regulator [Polyangiaceae bacterium]
MDRVFFALKRAYHSTLRITRRDFKDIDMTPARMDILHELYNEGRRRKQPIWQSTLRRIVGYTARSTMTQIMQALERLGLVSRRRSLQDERQLEVELTDAGFWALGRCNARFCPGWTYYALVWAKKWRDPHPEEEQAWDAYISKVRRLDKILLNIRIALRDTGCVWYPWWVH